MKLLSLATIATGLLIGVEAITNTTQEFRLKTALKPGQKGKSAYKDLYLEAYHTGAGLDDAVMVPRKSAGIKGFLNGTNGESGDVTCKLSTQFQIRRFVLTGFYRPERRLRPRH